MRTVRLLTLLALTTCFMVLISGCVSYRSLPAPPDPKAGAREHAHAEAVLESLVASANALYGPDITVEGTTVSVAAAPHAGSDDIDPFYAVYNFTISLTDEPALAFSFEEPITSYTPYQDGDEYWDRPHTRLDDFDVTASSFGVGPFGNLPPESRAAMFRLLANHDERPGFDTMDYTWVDPFGVADDWQQDMVQAIEDAGYMAEDYALVWWSEPESDKDVVQLCSFNEERGEWVAAKEWSGSWEELTYDKMDTSFP